MHEAFSLVPNRIWLCSTNCSSSAISRISFLFLFSLLRLLQTASPFPASGKKERKEICNSKIRQNTRRLTKSCIRSIMIAVFNIKQVDILYCCLIKEVATKPKQNYFIQRKASKLLFLHSANFSFTLLLCAYEY